MLLLNINPHLINHMYEFKSAFVFTSYKTTVLHMYHQITFQNCDFMGRQKVVSC